jgi:hypothetical protein
MDIFDATPANNQNQGKFQESAIPFEPAGCDLNA